MLFFRELFEIQRQYCEIEGVHYFYVRAYISATNVKTSPVRQSVRNALDWIRRSQRWQCRNNISVVGCVLGKNCEFCDMLLYKQRLKVMLSRCKAWVSDKLFGGMKNQLHEKSRLAIGVLGVISVVLLFCLLGVLYLYFDRWYNGSRIEPYDMIVSPQPIWIDEQRVWLIPTTSIPTNINW